MDIFRVEHKDRKRIVNIDTPDIKFSLSIVKSLVLFRGKERIDDYLAVRQRIGEQLKEKSPPTRDKFSIDNYFKAPRFLSLKAISLLFEEVLKKAGINQINPGHKKREVMQSHGFRKFFITQCDKAGLTFTAREYISGHRLPNQDASYLENTEEDRLKEYVAHHRS